MILKNLKVELIKYEEIIFNNEELFKREFCDKSVMDLNGVYFNSESMKVNYVLLNGQHISNTFKLEVFENWLKNKH